MVVPQTVATVKAENEKQISEQKKSLTHLEFENTELKDKINHIHTEIKEREVTHSEEIKEVRRNYKSVAEKLEFLEKYINLSDTIETQNDAEKLLHFLENMRQEKYLKEKEAKREK